MAKKKILDAEQDPMKFHVLKDLKEPNLRAISSSKYGKPARIVIEFFRTSQFFDGLVNTPARILINAMSFFVLYVWGYNVLDTESNFFWWVFTLIVLLGMQAASVRFVFQTEGIADEFQRARRDLAYRRAYRSLRILTAFPIALFSLFMGVSKESQRVRGTSLPTEWMLTVRSLLQCSYLQSLHSRNISRGE